MSSDEPTALNYDRQLLLLGAKRSEQLELREVLRYGTDSYQDANYVSIYGLQPTEWYARGIRLLGRTAVECTPDRLADAIGQDIARTASSGPPATRVVAIDPFAGSGNTLYWITRHVSQAVGVGFEVDPQVFQLTRQSLSILGLPVEILHKDYVTGLRDLRVPSDALLIVFIAPPWGNALSASEGLDLRHTTPPVSEIVDLIAERFSNPVLVAVQVYERVVAASLTGLTNRFDWSALHVYDVNSSGQKHGLLLATRGWRPRGRIDLEAEEQVGTSG